MKKIKITVMRKARYDDLIEKYENLRILNMEMESETIMTLGSLFDVLTGCICAVHANRKTDEWMEDFAEPQRQMCIAALEASVQLKNEYLK